MLALRLRVKRRPSRLSECGKDVDFAGIKTQDRQRNRGKQGQDRVKTRTQNLFSKVRDGEVSGVIYIGAPINYF